MAVAYIYFKACLSMDIRQVAKQKQFFKRDQKCCGTLRTNLYFNVSICGSSRLLQTLSGRDPDPLKFLLKYSF